MKVLITGSGGMVGRNLKERLTNDKLDLLCPSRKALNLLNIDALDKFLKTEKPDVIVHCAGLVGGIHANILSPYDFCYQNLQIGINLIESANNNGIQNIINLGSSCMYPRNAENPFKESQVLRGELEPTNEGYAIAKIAIAKLCEFMNQQHGRSYKTLIPCNLYGKWDDFDINKSHMIPGVIRRMHEAKNNGQHAITIWGNGETMREFMYAEDLADFISNNIQNIDILPEIMNIGLGVDYSINDYYQVISEVVGFQGEFEYDLTKPEGMKRKQVDITKQSKLNWAPSHDLKQGITKTYQYFLELIE